MLKVSGLSKHFGDNEVLKQINLEVKRREVVAIIGPSVSGKSTLLRCLNLLETPDAGHIEIDGFEVDARRLKKSDAYALRQKSAMFSSITIYSKIRRRCKTSLKRLLSPKR